MCKGSSNGCGGAVTEQLGALNATLGPSLALQNWSLLTFDLDEIYQTIHLSVSFWAVKGVKFGTIPLFGLSLLKAPEFMKIEN